MSDDITGDLDLLGDWLDAKGYTEEAGLCTRAMDEINKLREERDKFYIEYRMVCDEECKIVHAENEKLCAALKPFADILEKHGGFEKLPIDVAILYDAAAALKETVDGHKQQH